MRLCRVFTVQGVQVKGGKWELQSTPVVQSPGQRGLGLHLPEAAPFSNLHKGAAEWVSSDAGFLYGWSLESVSRLTAMISG